MVGKSDRWVRNWSDPDEGKAPNVHQALALDVAFLKAGGGEPPILSAYLHQLELATGGKINFAPLLDLVSKAAKESGEAISHLLDAAMPDATDEHRVSALKEGSEAVEAITTAMRAVEARRRLEVVR